MDKIVHRVQWENMFLKYTITGLPNDTDKTKYLTFQASITICLLCCIWLVVRRLLMGCLTWIRIEVHWSVGRPLPRRTYAEGDKFPVVRYYGRGGAIHMRNNWPVNTPVGVWPPIVRVNRPNIMICLYMARSFNQLGMIYSKHIFGPKYISVKYLKLCEEENQGSTY